MFVSGGRCLAYVINSVFRQPVKAFQKEKNGEEGHEPWTEVIAKHRERETCFSHREPCAIVQMLEETVRSMNTPMHEENTNLRFDRTQWSKEYFLHEFTEHDDKDECLHVENLQPALMGKDRYVGGSLTARLELDLVR